MVLNQEWFYTPSPLETFGDVMGCFGRQMGSCGGCRATTIYCPETRAVVKHYTMQNKKELPSPTWQLCRCWETQTWRLQRSLKRLAGNKMHVLCLGNCRRESLSNKKKVSGGAQKKCGLQTSAIQRALKPDNHNRIKSCFPFSPTSSCSHSGSSQRKV